MNIIKNLNLLITTKVLPINSNPAVFNNASPSEEFWADFVSRNEALNTPLSATKFQSKLPSACLLNHFATSLLAIFSFDIFTQWGIHSNPNSWNSSLILFFLA